MKTKRERKYGHVDTANAGDRGQYSEYRQGEARVPDAGRVERQATRVAARGQGRRGR